MDIAIQDNSVSNGKDESIPKTPTGEDLEQKEDNIAVERAKDVMALESELENQKNEKMEQLEDLISESGSIAVKDGKKVKISNEKLREDIKMAEDALQMKHRGLSRMTRGDLEKYLASLTDKLANKISQDQLIEKTSTPTEVESAKSKLQRELKKSIEKHEKDQLDKLVSSPNLPVAGTSIHDGAEFCYKTNFIFYFALEKLSKIGYDNNRIAFTLDGLTEELEGNKSKMVDVYKQLYKENKDIIDKYGSATAQLLMFNLSMITQVANNNAIKLKKK
jgi:hypothetical protein